jgi:hypothetical protein
VVTERVLKLTRVKTGDSSRNTRNDLRDWVPGKNGVTGKGLVVLEVRGVKTVNAVNERLRFNTTSLPAVIEPRGAVERTFQAGGNVDEPGDRDRAVRGVTRHARILGGEANGAGGIRTERVG